jgi:hypothetical protein
MVNRSDVQCRYRYHQIQKGRHATLASSEEEGEGEEPQEKVEVIKEVKEEATGMAPGEMVAIERAGLELGAHSMSDVFWALHL